MPPSSGPEGPIKRASNPKSKTRGLLGRVLGSRGGTQNVPKIEIFRNRPKKWAVAPAPPILSLRLKEFPILRPSRGQLVRTSRANSPVLRLLARKL